MELKAWEATEEEWVQATLSRFKARIHLQPNNLQLLPQEPLDLTPLTCLIKVR